MGERSRDRDVGERSSDRDVGERSSDRDVGEGSRDRDVGEEIEMWGRDVERDGDVGRNQDVGRYMIAKDKIFYKPSPPSLKLRARHLID